MAALPVPGTTLDESSGSTGRPYDWIRGQQERSVAHRNIGFFARYCYGPGPLITLNAFSMGAWAAGISMTQGMNRHGVVKSIGPDTDKVLTTLRTMGPGYRYADRGLSAVHQAPHRRGRCGGLPMGRLRRCMRWSAARA